MKTVREVAACSGVSVRTLHYYDEIGLLRPTGRTQAGYRLYDDAALARLQQILFFRELGFPLGEIRGILESSSFDERRALERHRSLLVMKRERLSGLIRLVDGILKGEKTVDLEKFDAGDIRQAREAYAQEAQQRWGDTRAYAQSAQKTAAYGEKEWRGIEEEAQGLYRGFAACMQDGPKSTQAMRMVQAWQQHITRHYYDCTDEILAGLGRMYACDDRFRSYLDAYADGLADFMGSAIAAYCKQKK